MREPSDVHNQVSREMIMKLRESLLAGATPTEIMVIGESVLIGLALLCIKLGGDELILDTMFKRAKERLAELRLSNLPSGGSA